MSATRIGYICDQPGFNAEKQRAILTAAGVTKIYVEGQGAETLESALRALRGEMLLACAGGLRALGNSLKQIMDRFAIVKKRRAEIVDVETGARSDRDGAEMIDAALSRIHGERTMPTKEHASAIGKKGAQSRAQALWDRRAPENVARATWFNPQIPTDAEAAARLGEGWSPATLRRKFKSSGRPQGRRAASL